MDVVERLTLEAAQADTMIACEHRHRYELAARLCAGKRVLDLCCGSGYGTAILAAGAREVVGVDNDAATVETAVQTIGRDAPNISFQLADAVAVLGGGRPGTMTWWCASAASSASMSSIERSLCCVRTPSAARRSSLPCETTRCSMARIRPTRRHSDTTRHSRRSRPSRPP